jgi:hypothetical protein
MTVVLPDLFRIYIELVRAEILSDLALSHAA